MSFFINMQDYFTLSMLVTCLRYAADVVIITVMIYYILYFLRGTRSANVLFGIIGILVGAAIVVEQLQLVTLSYLFNGMWTIMGTAMVVIFQPEIRRVFAQAGSMFASNKTDKKSLDEVVNAVVQMAAEKTGALIVFERQIGLASIVNQAYSLDCKVSSALLQTIFFKNSPLHDCAVIIRDNKIVAARGVLPLTQYASFSMGTRHRAAIGITEETDAVAVVVSEETGYISLANKGNLMRRLSADELKEWLVFFILRKDGISTLLKRVKDNSAASSQDAAQSPQTHSDLFDKENF